MKLKSSSARGRKPWNDELITNKTSTCLLLLHAMARAISTGLSKGKWTYGVQANVNQKDVVKKLKALQNDGENSLVPNDFDGKTIDTGKNLNICLKVSKCLVSDISPAGEFVVDYLKNDGQHHYVYVERYNSRVRKFYYSDSLGKLDQKNVVDLGDDHQIYKVSAGVTDLFFKTRMINRKIVTVMAKTMPITFSELPAEQVSKNSCHTLALAKTICNGLLEGKKKWTLGVKLDISKEAVVRSVKRIHNDNDKPLFLRDFHGKTIGVLDYNTGETVKIDIAVNKENTVRDHTEDKIMEEDFIMEYKDDSEPPHCVNIETFYPKKRKLSQEKIRGLDIGNQVYRVSGRVTNLSSVMMSAERKTRAKPMKRSKSMS